jgi:hypothetical protein
MSAEAAEETKGPGIVLQPEEGQSYWQSIWANGYSIVKLSPKHAGPDNFAMGIQVIAPGGYVREHSHTPNEVSSPCPSASIRLINKWEECHVEPQKFSVTYRR